MGCATSCPSAPGPAEASPAPPVADPPTGSNGPTRPRLPTRRNNEGGGSGDPARCRRAAARNGRSTERRTVSFDGLEQVEEEPSPINLRVLLQEETEMVHSPVAQGNPPPKERQKAVSFALPTEPGLPRTKGFC
eukprot:EG_transcript_46846